MLDEFKIHIKSKFPELLEKPFLLACSGGVDSMVLTDLCLNNEMDFQLAHCNFQLRGADSDGDVELVVDIARKSEKKIHVTHFDTIGYMNKYKVSVQMAARTLRYSWFAEIMQQNGIGILVTAHHADDNLETFLINLSRGTGIEGLTGIPEKTDSIARPLLTFSQEQIKKYAQARSIEWREDSSNAETKYVRNKIRHKILPELKALSPAFLDNFHKTQRYLLQSSAIANAHIQNLRSTIFIVENDIIRIPVAKINNLNPIQGYLYGLFNEYGFTEWNDVENLLTAMSGKEISSKTHRLIKDRKNLLLKRITSTEAPTYHIAQHQKYVDCPITITITEVDTISETATHILYADKNALKYPLTLRKWKKGDYFYPFGMKGSKKLSKFFKDEKMDVFAKENQWMLCSNGSIVWVIGRRGDERFRVVTNTEKIIKFEVKQ